MLSSPVQASDTNSVVLLTAREVELPAPKKDQKLPVIE